MRKIWLGHGWEGREGGPLQGGVHALECLLGLVEEAQDDAAGEFSLVVFVHLEDLVEDFAVYVVAEIGDVVALVVLRQYCLMYILVHVKQSLLVKLCRDGV